MKIGLVSLGCPKNLVDSEVMLGIAQAASDTAGLAGIQAQQVDALYFTGGSTGLEPLAERIAGQFPSARVIRGHRFASVAQGLGIHAQRVFA